MNRRNMLKTVLAGLLVPWKIPKRFTASDFVPNLHVGANLVGGTFTHLTFVDKTTKLLWPMYKKQLTTGNFTVKKS